MITVTGAEDAVRRPVSSRPVIAIVGRPNVGKSTLFNRLVRARQAIVEDEPGTTRDRLYGEAEWKERTFLVIDTGGLELDAAEGYPTQIREQVEHALEDADVVLFVVDATTGPTPVDVEIGELLRRGDKPVLLLANKADNERRAELAVDFYSMGLGDPLPLSAYHGTGVREVLDELLVMLPEASENGDTDVLRLAIIGRPNVGKSALVNAILGEERVIVSDVAGTTRDAIDTPLAYKERAVTLIDTAGIRRPGKVARGVEKYSVMRAREALERCDVAVLVLDATQGVAAQDLHIAGYVADNYKGLIVAANKWDLVDDSPEERKLFARKALFKLRFTPWAPLVFVSALTGLSVTAILDVALDVAEARSKRIPTAELNSAIREAVAAHPPSGKGRRFPRIKYVTQAEVNPPTFVFFTNDASLIHFSYRRYLENQLRERFGFDGTAIKMEFRSRRE